jgi:hypothetical protein
LENKEPKELELAERITRLPSGVVVDGRKAAAEGLEGGFSE